MAVEAGSIGARLRAGREKMGLTVLQVAERIHTDPKIVEAIESDNYSVLGAPVYARGHIKHYAELVSESAVDLTAQYSDLSKVAQPDLTQIVKAPPAGDSNKLVASAVVVIGVFAVAGAIWWVSALSKKKPQMSETHVVGDEQPASQGGGAPGTGGASSDGGAPVEGGVPHDGGTPGGVWSPGGGATSDEAARGVPSGGAAGGAAAGADARGGGAGSGGASVGSGASGSSSRGGAGSGVSAGSPPPSHGAVTGGGSRNGSPSAGAAASNRAAAVAANPPSSTPPHSASGTQTGSSSSATPPQPTRLASVGPTPTVGSVASAPPSPPHPKNQAQVTLRYSADSWTEVYDANGTRLFYDVGSANSVQTMVGTPPLRVVLGNASGVAVEFNGHNTPIAKLAHPDGSVQFSITGSGRVVRAKPVTDGG